MDTCYDDDTLGVRHERNDEPKKTANETGVVRRTDKAGTIHGGESFLCVKKDDRCVSSPQANRFHESEHVRDWVMTSAVSVLVHVQRPIRCRLSEGLEPHEQDLLEGLADRSAERDASIVRDIVGFASVCDGVQLEERVDDSQEPFARDYTTGKARREDECEAGHSTGAKELEHAEGYAIIAR